MLQAVTSFDELLGKFGIESDGDKLAVFNTLPHYAAYREALSDCSMFSVVQALGCQIDYL